MYNQTLSHTATPGAFARIQIQMEDRPFFSKTYEQGVPPLKTHMKETAQDGHFLIDFCNSVEGGHFIAIHHRAISVGHEEG